jgi:hypothetical protein
LGANRVVSFIEDAASAALVVALTPVVLAFFRGPERMAADALAFFKGPERMAADAAADVAAADVAAADDGVEDDAADGLVGRL